MNNSELLYQAAQLLKAQGRENIIITLIGDGQHRKELEERSQKENLSTFRIVGLMPKTQLAGWYASATASLVPLNATPILDTSSPNKLFDSLAAGVAVIQTTQGWIKAFLEKEACGLTVSAEKAEELADAIIYIVDHPEEAMKMAQNGKRLAQTEFDRNVLAQKMIDGIEKAMKV